MNLIALLLSLSLINAFPTDSNIEKRGLNLNIFSKLKPSFKRPAPIHKSKTNNLGKVHFSTESEARKIIESWESAQRDYQVALKDVARKRKIYKNTNKASHTAMQYNEAVLKAESLKKVADSLDPAKIAKTAPIQAKYKNVQASLIDKQAENQLQSVLRKTRDPLKVHAAVAEHGNQKLMSQRLRTEAISLYSKALIAREAQRLSLVG